MRYGGLLGGDKRRLRSDVWHALRDREDKDVRSMPAHARVRVLSDPSSSFVQTLHFMQGAQGRQGIARPASQGIGHLEGPAEGAPPALHLGPGWIHRHMNHPCALGPGARAPGCVVSRAWCAHLVCSAHALEYMLHMR